MAFSADTLLERIKLKSQVSFWRNIAIISFVAIGLLIISNTFNLNPDNAFIARLDVKGIIVTDSKRIETLIDIKNNNNAKALIINVDSPGGTIVGGETLHNAIVEISKVKPVVVTMGNIAASGGYMVAIAGDRVFSRKGTLTGSVGVILQSFDATKMAEKIGIDFVTFKSGDMKAVPTPTARINPKQRQIIQNAIDEMQGYFIGLVKDKRNLEPEQLEIISDGRIFTGTQALEHNLVDAIGGQAEAVEWLRTEKKIPKSIKVRQIKVKRPNDILDKLSTKILGKSINYDIYNSNGLMAIWKP